MSFILNSFIDFFVYAGLWFWSTLKCVAIGSVILLPILWFWHRLCLLNIDPPKPGGKR